MMNKVRTLTAAAAIAATGVASAATDTANMDVTLLVDTACAIQSVPSLSLAGGSGSGWVSNFSAGSIDVLCAPGVNYSLSVSGSQNGYGTYYDRLAVNAGNTLYYYVWDSISGMSYGDGYNTFNGDLRYGTGDGSTQQYPVAIEAYFDYVPAGAYTDTLVVTVTY